MGVRGARVKNIVRELNNEKVDIIRWHSDPQELVKEALKPAKIHSIIMDTAAKKISVTVGKEELSQAIGRRGQNARLTAKLKSLEIDEAAKRVKVIVDEENLSLAIGRRGQNARLTQKLTGWEIDIQKEQSTAMAFEDQLNQAATKMASLLQIEPAVASQVVRAGFLSLEGILEVDADEFSSALPEVDPELARKIHATAVSQTKATPAS